MNKSILTILCILVLLTDLNAQVTERNILSKISITAIREVLPAKDEWQPFPRTAAEWRQRIDDSVINRMIHEAEPFTGKPFESISASLLLEFIRTGDRSHHQQLSFSKRERLFAMVLAESMEGKGRYADAIADGVWNICEETFWGVPAHLFAQKAGPGLPDVQDPTVDLFAAETAAVLALADYFVGDQLDKISPLLRPRIYFEVNKRILLPLETASGRYKYLGSLGVNAVVNNWNPWVISNWMISLLLLEKNQDRRVQEMHHALGLMDLYINGLGDDGASDEGPDYWFAAGGALFDALSVFQNATGNKVDILRDPFIKLIGSYVYKTHIRDSFFVNVADAHPSIKPDGVLLYRFGKATGDTTLSRFGSWAYRNLNEKNAGTKIFFRPRTLFNLLAEKECAAAPGQQPQPGNVWLQSVQLMTSRTDNGFFVSAHGGHNAESHNHNDVGDFIVYYDGKPVIIDAGSGTYTAATFTDARYTLWYNTSPYHNLPTINGVPQKAGREYEAKDVNYAGSSSGDTFSLDIAAAYPADAGIASWKRMIAVNKKAGNIEIKDKYRFNAPNNGLTQTFMTICSTSLDIPGKIMFATGTGTVTLTYNPKMWKVTKEKASLSKTDEQGLKKSWSNNTIWRILLTNIDRRQTGEFIYKISSSK